MQDQAKFTMTEGKPAYYQQLPMNSTERKPHFKTKADGKYYIHPLNVMGERARVHLMDTEQPTKSLQSFLDSRHDEFGTRSYHKEQVDLIRSGKKCHLGSKLTSDFSRSFLEWPADKSRSPSPRLSPRGGYNPDREVTGKIG